MKAILPFVFALFTLMSFGQVKPKASGQTKIQPKIIINDGSFFSNLKAQNVSASTIQNNLNEWLGLSKDHKFIEVSSKKDDLGFTNQNFQQYYKNVPVDGGAVMLHSKNGIASTLNGMIVPIEDFEIKTRVTTNDAKSNAMKALNATKLIAEYPIELVLLQIETDKRQETKIAYKVRIDASEPVQMVNLFIDAVSGAVLRKINLIAHADEPATAQTLYRGVKPITVESNQGSFRLRESGRKIETYNATGATFNNASGFQNFSDFTNPTTTWSTAIPALDVHWGMEETYDFYLETFNRTSYDNLGSPIKNFVNGTVQIANTQNNAFAMPPPYNVMVFGLGDGVAFSPVVGLDVAGHEFSHMIVQNNGSGGLTYFGESGALNESFADIFGTGVEFHSGDNPNWTIGEDVVLTAPFFLRSMSNPNATNDADTFNGTFWRSTTSNTDSGGVHHNSAVQNFWFYLITEGGTGTNDFGYNYNVEAIGMEKALQIAYRSLTTYLPSNATFKHARQGALQATEDLYGIDSPEYASVLEAWNAVNVLGNPVPSCNGTTTLTDATGTFSDNSGNDNYLIFSDCKWLIAPQDAQQITLSFPAFRTEFDFDFVTIYNGPTNTSPVLGSFSGTSIPAAVSTSMGVGSMLVEFKSDFSVNEQGWTANYTSIGSSTCVTTPIFTTATGTFNDGSGNSNYGNNQHCTWLIAPTCTSSISLTFSELETEENTDNILVYDDALATNLIATVSGNAIPVAIVSTTGIIAVHFVTDNQNQMQGFTANYTSTPNTPVAYTGNSVQNFCESATVGDFSQNAATRFFAEETGGIPLVPETSLNNGQMYFATQDFGCETLPRFAITANIIARPVLDSLPNIRKCVRYILPALEKGNYFTGSNGSGEALSAGSEITSSQTIFVFVASEQVNDCTAEISFEVEINNDCEPTFYADDFSICEGTLVDPLLPFTESGINGTWSPPDINNLETTTYTFTPDDDGDFLPTTLTITVNSLTTPTFDAVAAICAGGSLSALPTTSLNNITGTWSPALDRFNTTTYTFSPNDGQCALPTTLTITVNQIVTPTFDQVAEICTGESLSALPTTSLNGVTGTWSPEINTTETTIYLFTPDAGECGVTVQMMITVNPMTIPSFGPVAAVCPGENLSALPTTSLNGITGTWSPELNNLQTTTYTFTPNSGQCATIANKTILILNNQTPSFNQVPAICAGGNLSALPTTSDNGIDGNWSPEINNLETTTYTFTPTSGLCSIPTTMTITVTPNVTPTFDQVPAVCIGQTTSMPITSNNGIDGSWSPNFNILETTTYTFTPLANQCALTTTMTVVVNQQNAPVFDDVTICQGTPFTLPTSSDNGIAGTFSGAVFNPNETANYNFQPFPGQCAAGGTLHVIVIPNTVPEFNAVPTICSGESVSALPTTSVNGITGNWSPVLNNTETTTYTFTPDGNQCSATTTLTINVNTVDATTSLDAETITASQANAFYQWINCNGNAIIEGANAPSFTAVENGDYAVIITMGDCSVTSECVTISTLGVANTATERFAIYPNPTSSILYLKMPQDFNVEHIAVFDVTGKRVIDIENTVSEINVDRLESGVYIIHAYSRNKLFQDKFIKK